MNTVKYIVVAVAQEADMDEILDVQTDILGHDLSDSVRLRL